MSAITIVPPLSTTRCRFSGGTTAWRAIVFSAGVMVCLFFSLVPALAAGESRLEKQPVERRDAVDPPNIMIILVDDLGFSDVGCYGGEIDTPNLDRLAATGIRFSQFYNTGRCWPTRAAILTGYYAQQVRRDRLPGIRSGGGGKRPNWGRLIPQMLKPLGYRSYHSGKWHLDGKPIASGFEASYWLNDHGRFFSPQKTWLNDRPLPPVERGTGYYSTSAVADNAIRQLKEHHRGHRETPFFQFVAFTAPHFPLQALPEDISKYQGKYDEGWHSIRKRRWQRVQELGIVEGTLSAVDRKQGPPYPLQDSFSEYGPGEVAYPVPWDDLSVIQQKFQSSKMAIHAAMVDRVDQEIGGILEQLKAMNELDNTLLFFLSDNGASAEIMIRSDGHDRSAAMGSADTHLCLGPGWSTVGNTPFRKHKTWVHEGGIATPLIVHWPAGIKSRGEIRHTVGHVIDLVPTIVEVAGGQLKQVTNQPKYPGQSLLPSFSADTQAPREAIWWSHEGHRAIRKGEWKLVKTKSTEWELFKITSDRTESADLSSQFPERVESLAAEWRAMEDEFVRQLKSLKASKK